MRSPNGPGAQAWAGLWSLAAVAFCAGHGCSDPAASASPVASGADAGAEKSGCAAAQLREDGTCCPTGTIYVYDSSACVPIGPAPCAAVALSDPATCVLRWCGTVSRDDNGEPCEQLSSVKPCHEEPRPCPGDEAPREVGAPLDRVLAGRWPLSPDAALPEPADPLWCWDWALPSGAGCAPFSAGCVLAGRMCTDAELAAGGGCPAGSGPRVGMTAKCVPAGGKTGCPDGFIPGPGSLPGVPANCEPDPADCGADPFGGLQDAPKNRFVSASAKPAGDGTRAKPWSDLATAVAKAPTGAVIAIAAGSYDVGLKIARPLTLRGHCAATTTLRGVASAAAVIEAGSKTAGAIPLRLEGLSITGPRHGIEVTAGLPVMLDRVQLHGLSGVAVDVDYGLAELRRTLVLNSAGKPSLPSGGLVAQNAAKVALIDVRMAGARPPSLAASGDGTDVRANGLVITGAQQSAILVSGDASFSAIAAWLHGNGRQGVLALNGSDVVLRGGADRRHPRASHRGRRWRVRAPQSRRPGRRAHSARAQGRGRP